MVGCQTGCHKRVATQRVAAKRVAKRVATSDSLLRFHIESHLATRPRARTNKTKRFPGRSHPPASDIYIYIYNSARPVHANARGKIKQTEDCIPRAAISNAHLKKCHCDYEMIWGPYVMIMKQ